MAHTPGPWEYVPSDQYHGPYVAADYGGDICDCYTMSRLGEPSERNGGKSRPVLFQGENADANARLIAAAPELLDALKMVMQHGRIDNSESRMNAVAAVIAKATGG